MATFPAYILIFKFVKYSRTSDFLDIVFFPTLMSYFHCLGDFTAHRDIDMKLYNTELRYIVKLYFKPLSILFTLQQYFTLEASVGEFLFVTVMGGVYSLTMKN